MLAAVALAARADVPPGRRERAVSASVRTVAAYLGNTPAVCRASYVDPRVIDRYKAAQRSPPRSAAPTATDPTWGARACAAGSSPPCSSC